MIVTQDLKKIGAGSILLMSDLYNTVAQLQFTFPKTYINYEIESSQH